jgi:hypothetical protein
MEPFPLLRIRKIKKNNLALLNFTSEEVFISLDALNHIRDRRGDKTYMILAKIKEALAHLILFSRRGELLVNPF